MLMFLFDVFLSKFDIMKFKKILFNLYFFFMFMCEIENENNV